MATLFCHSVSMAESTSDNPTLLIYDTLAKPFSAVNEIEPIMITLTRFEGGVDKKEAAHLTVGDIEKASRIILVGVSGIPKIDPACQRLIEKTDKPVMGIAHAANFGQGSDIKSLAVDNAVVQYRNAKWTVRLDPLFPQSPKGGRILAEAGTGSGEKNLGMAGWKPIRIWCIARQSCAQHDIFRHPARFLRDQSHRGRIVFCRGGLPSGIGSIHIEEAVGLFRLPANAVHRDDSDA